MKRFSAIAVTYLLCPLSPHVAEAQVPPYNFFPDDKTISTQQAQGDSIVGFKEFKDGAFQVPSSPVIDLVKDGRLFRFAYLFNQSTLNVNGGTASVIRPRDESRVNLINGIVLGEITADSKSRITISGGEVGLGVSGRADTTIIMSGGKVAQSLNASNRSTVTLSGGTVGHLGAYGGAIGTMTGGRVQGNVTSAGLESEMNVILADVVGNLDAGGHSTLTLTGGVVGGGATAGEFSGVNLNGGSLGGSLRAAVDGFILLNGATVGGGANATDGQLTIRSGSIAGSLGTAGQAVVIMSGGTIGGDVSAGGRTTMALNGGNVAGNMFATDQSTVNLDGISIAGTVQTDGTSVLNLRGGNFPGFVQAEGSSTINMTGGFATTLIARGSATVTLASGTVGRSDAQNSGMLLMTGGSVTGALYAFAGGRVIQSGGHVAGIVNALGSSSVVLSGGVVGGEVEALESSVISKIGGSSGNFKARENGTIELIGGFVNGDLAGFHTSTVIVTGGVVSGESYFDEGVTVHISGGSIFGDLAAAKAGGVSRNGLTSRGSVNADGDARPVIFDGNATLEMFGTNLTATLIDPNREGIYGAYRLAGTLGDGTDVTGALIYIRNETDAGFQLSDVPDPSPWRLDTDGNWSATKNWIGPVPNGVGATARFLGRIKQDRTVHVDGNFTVGQMIFDNPDASYTISARSIRIEGDQRKIDVVSGAHTITTRLDLTGETEIAVAQDAALTFGNFTMSSAVAVNKTGPGTINAAGFFFAVPNALLDVRQGTVNAGELYGNRGVFAGVTERYVGKVNVGPGATLVTGLVWLTELAVPGGSAIIQQSGSGPDNPSNNSTAILQNLSLGETPESPAPTGRLDIANNKLIIAAGTPEKLSRLRNQLIVGRNAAPGGVANGKWNGVAGIVSSSAAAANAGAPESRSIGYALNGDNALVNFTQFGGKPVEEGDLLVRYTRNGDANLDGAVNNNDITVLAGFYRPGVMGRHWYQADFNYDGEVNNNDITILAGFYAPTAPPIASGEPLFAVPEPSMALLALLPLIGLCRRRG